MTSARSDDWTGDLEGTGRPARVLGRPDEQPIRRVIGTRQMPLIGTLPSAAARAAMAANAGYRTRVPKGIFFYADAEQMNRDRERWTVELMLSRRAERRARATARSADGHD